MEEKKQKETLNERKKEIEYKNTRIREKERERKD